MSKDLIEESDEDFKVEVQAAILTTFEYDETLLNSLFANKIPTTVFEDKLKRATVDHILIEDDKLNYNKVNVHKYGQVPYASYHSKMIIYEFDDRLRVIVTSANLTNYMWKSLQ